MQHQLPLGFEFNNELTFASFITGANLEVVDVLQKLGGEQAESTVFLWGAKGSGKSHLLQALCQHVAAGEKPVALLPMELNKEYSPEILQGLENLALVCIDDVSAVSGMPAWEEALFHLFNRMREKGTPLLVSANSPPLQLPIQLKDLKSRLTWGLVLQVHALNDDDKILALQRRAQIRGMELSDEVGRFLLSRYSRDMVSLMELLNMLDKASLSEQRRLTIPFVRQYLDQQG